MISVSNSKINKLDGGIKIVIGIVFLFLFGFIIYKRVIEKEDTIILNQAIEVKRIIDTDDKSGADKVKDFCALKKVNIPKNARTMADEIYKLTDFSLPTRVF